MAKFYPATPFSRRAFLKSAAASALALPAIGMIETAQAQEPESNARARKLLDACMAVDMHSHVGGARQTRQINDFPTIKTGGLSAVCMSLVSDSTVIHDADRKIQAFRQPQSGELYANMSDRLDYADQAIKKHNLRRITTLAGLKTSKQEGTPGIILATEGSDFIEGKLERLQTVYERGVRHIQLVHYRQDNGIGDIQTEKALYQGATPLGLDIVRTCNRLGIVVDVAHATFETVEQIVKVSTTPLILSHTSFAEKHASFSRTIGAKHAKTVADTGGVVGVWSSASYFPGYAALARNVADLAEAIGVDHVGIGTDLNGLPHPLMRSGYTTFPDMVTALFQYFNEDDLRKILGGNYLRVFDQVTSGKT